MSLLRERVRFDSWSLPYWLAVGLGALAYYALAKLGMQFFSRELGVSPVWPASGLAVAMIRLFGLRMWPAIFIGALSASIFGQSQIVAVISAIGSTLEGVVGGLIINRLVSRHSDSFIMARVLGIVLAALWAALIGTALGVSATYVFGRLTVEGLGAARVARGQAHQPPRERATEDLTFAGLRPLSGPPGVPENRGSPPGNPR